MKDFLQRGVENVVLHSEDVASVGDEVKCLIHTFDDADDGTPSVLVIGRGLKLLAVVPGIGGGA